MTTHQLKTHLESLAQRRPIFHSEADFQHELALELSRAGYGVRLEVPHSVLLGGVSVAVELDLRVVDPQSRKQTAIELKYAKAATRIVLGGESFSLKNTAGTNLSRFDCLADFQRVGRLVETQQADVGFALFLTNAPTFWEDDVGITDNQARQFSIHAGRTFAAGEALDWVPVNPKTSSVTKKRLSPYSPVIIPRAARCMWTDYSAIPAPNGTLRYLLSAI